MSCKGRWAQIANGLGAARVANGQVDAADRCKDRRCHRPLRRDGTCVEGHPQVREAAIRAAVGQVGRWWDKFNDMGGWGKRLAQLNSIAQRVGGFPLAPTSWLSVDTAPLEAQEQWLRDIQAWVDRAPADDLAVIEGSIEAEFGGGVFPYGDIAAALEMPTVEEAAGVFAPEDLNAALLCIVAEVQEGAGDIWEDDPRVRAARQAQGKPAQARDAIAGLVEVFDEWEEQGLRDWVADPRVQVARLYMAQPAPAE